MKTIFHNLPYDFVANYSSHTYLTWGLVKHLLKLVVVYLFKALLVAIMAYVITYFSKGLVKNYKGRDFVVMSYLH